MLSCFSFNQDFDEEAISFLMARPLVINPNTVNVNNKLKYCDNTIYVQGALVSGLAYYMQVWVIDKSGPVFLAMTMPITLIVTIVLSSFVLGEAVTLGRYYYLSFLLISSLLALS